MFSANLKRYRTKQKLKKSELSQKSGLSARTIEFLETGKLKNPTLSTLKSLSEALDVTIEELIK